MLLDVFWHFLPKGSNLQGGERDVRVNGRAIRVCIYSNGPRPSVSLLRVSSLQRCYILSFYVRLYWVLLMVPPDAVGSAGLRHGLSGASLSDRRVRRVSNPTPTRCSPLSRRVPCIPNSSWHDAGECGGNCMCETDVWSFLSRRRGRIFFKFFVVFWRRVASILSLWNEKKVAGIHLIRERSSIIRLPSVLCH